jgi:hypothetical protein
MLYEVNFNGVVEVTTKEIDAVRKDNRNFLMSDYFKKDKMIAKVIAYNKISEAIKKGDESLVSYTINLIQEED